MSNAAAANAATPANTLDPAVLQAHAQTVAQESAVWFAANWLSILIALAVASGIAALLFLAKGWARGQAAKPGVAIGIAGVIARAVGRTGTFFIVMVAARLVAGYAAPPPLVASTINFLFTVAVVFQAAIWAREIILGLIERRTQASDHATLGSALGIIRLLVTFALFAIALIVVLDNLGVNVTGLVAGLGVGGIAIGLAAQGIFADLFAALAIIFDRPFRVGDVIAYDQTTGTVEAIGLKSTRVRSATGEQRIISNKSLLDKEIQNITERDYRRVIFTLGLAQWTPVEVMRALPEVLKEEVEGAGHKFVRLGFVAFGASSYDFQLEFDSQSGEFAPFFQARHDVALRVIDRLNRDGVDLAYPTQTSLNALPDGRFVLPFADAPRGGPQPAAADGV